MKKFPKNNAVLSGTAWAEEVWGESWAHIKSVVDTAREPFLILDHSLRILAANEAFYQVFQVKPKDTENKLVYELGNGQWNIPTLKKLLESILPRETFFKGFEVNHLFPNIGRKVMLLNARQVHRTRDVVERKNPKVVKSELILLAIENVSDIMLMAEKIAEKFSGNTSQHEMAITKRTKELESTVKDLKKEITILQKKITYLVK